MSHTIHQVPAAGSSMHTPLWHVISSTNYTQDHFRYIFTIFVYDPVTLTANEITTFKVMPDGNGLGILDVSPVIRDFLTEYYFPSGLTNPLLFATDNIKVQYQVFYREEYTVTGVPNNNFLVSTSILTEQLLDY